MVEVMVKVMNRTRIRTNDLEHLQGIAFGAAGGFAGALVVGTPSPKPTEKLGCLESWRADDTYSRHRI